MLPKWPEILRVAAVGLALLISTVSLPAQAQESQGGTTIQEPESASSGYAEGYSHYNLVQGPEVAQVIERFLTQPTSSATQFGP